ncbi:MAG: methyltransferase, partial [Lachnospiraceae bacterium]|nr:methyltransferase [Lachnospiraceae bacterium]
MTINLNCDERLDDLGRKGYKLIQNKNAFCFGMDSVLLAAFAKANEEDKCIDLGCGNGIIPILLEARTNAKHIIGLEIQDISVDLAKRSVEYNGLNDKINIVQGDIKEASSIFGAATFDVVTSNPPYMNENHGLKNPQDVKAIARH